MRKIFLPLALTLIGVGAASCSDSALKKANEQLAADKIKLEAELSAAKQEIASLKSANNSLDSEKISRIIRDNANSISLLLETYAVDHDGKYPADLESARKEGQEKMYLKGITNPVSKAEWGYDKIEDGVVIQSPIPQNCTSGAIYLELNPGHDGYSISMCTAEGRPFMQGNRIYQIKTK